MPIDELVAINGLLIDRETCYAEVNRIEMAVSDILGQAYPFPPPTSELPSKITRKATPGKKRPSPKPLPKIRRLQDGEQAYRVTTHEQGQTRQQSLRDFSPFAELFANPLPSYRITRIETIRDQGELAALLWEES